MKNILQYTRQLRQRRLSVFDLSLHDVGDGDPYDSERQLPLNYHATEVDARALRRRLAELEYDDEV